MRDSLVPVIVWPLNEYDLSGPTGQSYIYVAPDK